LASRSSLVCKWAAHKTVIELLEPRWLLSGAYVVDGVQPVALDQPQIIVSFKRTPDGQPLMADDGSGNLTPADGAYLDTGTSTMLLSNESTQAFGINSQPNDIYHDIGVAGGQTFDVSEPLYMSTANWNNVNDGSDPSQFTQSYPVARMELNPTPADIFSLPLDVMGMPLIQGKVMVFDPTPSNSEQELFDGLARAYLYNPGTPFNAQSASTDPGIPATNLHVKVSNVSFDQFTFASPAGAPLPTLNDNPMIGPDPVAILNGQSGGNVPPVTIGENGQTGTGSFLFDTGAQISFISTAMAAKVGVHYEAGTQNSDNPVLVDGNGNPLPNQFQELVGGVGGQTAAAGFYLDSLTLPTTEGTPLQFTHAPVLVTDVTATDPNTGKSLTIDGDFGVNFYAASAQVDPFGTVTNKHNTDFNWMVYDQPNSVVGFDLASLDTGKQPPVSLTAQTAGSSFYVKADADGQNIDIWQDSPTPGQGTPTDQELMSTFNGINVSGGSGNDSVTLDFSNGTPAPSGLTFTGGAGNNVLHVIGTSGADAISVDGSKIAVGTTVANYSGVSSITYTTGGGSDFLSVSGSTPVNLAAGTGNAVNPIQLSSLSVGAGAKVSALSAANHAGRSVLVVSSLSLDPKGLLDLNDNDLIVKGADVSSLSSLLASGRGTKAGGIADGTWTGTTGITSSAAATQDAADGQETVALGIALNGQLALGPYSTFDGQAVGASDVLIKYTYTGDMNLDGKVDNKDVAIIAGFYDAGASTGNLWSNGDLNGDGKIDQKDIAILAGFYGDGTNGDQL
jgi:hypothetical protein